MAFYQPWEFLGAYRLQFWSLGHSLTAWLISIVFVLPFLKQIMYWGRPITAGLL
jgi:hypothetical protein